MENEAKKRKLETEEKKYSQYLPSFFPPPHSKNIKFTEEKVLSFVTPFKTSQKMTNWLIDQSYSLNGKDLEGIIDATSNIGGDTLTFCMNKKFYEVIGIELDQERFECLKYNIDLYKKDIITKPKLNNENFIDWWLKQDKKKYSRFCIFVDPPWQNGDEQYKDYDRIDDLYLTDDAGKNYSMLQLTSDLLEHVSCVVLKLPYNYNISTLTKYFEIYAFFIKKVVFVFIDHSNRGKYK